SLAINRHEINMVVFYGLATEGNNTALKESQLYDPEFQKAWARFDLKQANKLLEEMGLTKRSGGYRLLPDGREATILLESPGDSADQTDALQLVKDSWRQIGIRLLVKATQTSFFRNRVFSGQSIMSVFFGAENGLPTPTSSPAEWAPTAQWQLQWSQWGNFVETGGKAGEAIDLPEAKELLELYHRWTQATTMDERKEVWHKMLAINADQVFSIGLASAVPQPV